MSPATWVKSTRLSGSVNGAAVPVSEGARRIKGVGVHRGRVLYLCMRIPEPNQRALGSGAQEDAHPLLSLDIEHRHQHHIPRSRVGQLT